MSQGKELTPQQWERSREPREALIELKGDIEALRGTVEILWRFFIWPIWGKYQEVSANGSEENGFSSFNADCPFPAPEETWVSQVPGGLSLKSVKAAYVMKELIRCGGNKARTAKSLGIVPKTLYAILEGSEDAGKEAKKDTL